MYCLQEYCNSSGLQCQTIGTRIEVSSPPCAHYYIILHCKEALGWHGCSSTMKLTVLCRRVVTYITHDLKEILLPSSLPNPPGYVPPPRRPIKDYFKV